MLPMERIRAKVADLEERRSRSLLSRRVIGKVSSWKGDITYNINIRRVNFKWQRGNKIGEPIFFFPSFPFCRGEAGHLSLLYALVHENGGYWYVLTGNGVFGRRARSNPPLSAQTRQSGNSGKSLAGNGVQSAISRHCPPIPASLGTQAKTEEQIWRDPA